MRVLSHNQFSITCNKDTEKNITRKNRKQNREGVG